jgi:hypothetical protein
MAIRNLLVDLFLEAHARAPRQIILDLDGTPPPGTAFLNHVILPSVMRSCEF